MAAAHGFADDAVTFANEALALEPHNQVATHVLAAAAA
jgi:hypothetical protein